MIALAETCTEHIVCSTRILYVRSILTLLLKDLKYTCRQTGCVCRDYYVKTRFSLDQVIEILYSLYFYFEETFGFSSLLATRGELFLATSHT